MKKYINSFDCDGVINIPNGGVYPGPDDVIISGRSILETKKTIDLLHSKGIKNKFYLNDIDLDKKTDKASGMHKVKIIKMLYEQGIYIQNFFEDNKIQAAIIEKMCPKVNVILINSNLDPADDTNY